MSNHMTIFGENYFLQEGFFDNMKKKKQEKEAAKKKANEARWWNQEQDHLIELKNKYDKFIKKAWELNDRDNDLLLFAKYMGMTESKLINLYNKSNIKQISIENYDGYIESFKALGNNISLNTKVTPVYINDDYGIFIFNNVLYEFYDVAHKSTYDKIIKWMTNAADFDKSDIQKMIKQNWKKVEVEV